MKTCPICGKDYGHNFTPSNLKKHKYCSKKCAEVARRLFREDKSCPECGQTFTPQTAVQKYCTPQCGTKHKGRHGIHAQKECTCEHCGKTFVTWNSRPGRFCSAQCRSEFGARQPKIAARRPENFVTQNCAECGKPYTRHKIFTEKRHSRFCCRTCQDAFMSKSMRGTGHPRWKGGQKHDRGRNWTKQRKLAFKRDGGKCQICGKANKNTRKKRWIDVHHIVPYMTFNGDWETANQLSNLITLCRDCHGDVEDRGRPCPKHLF